jgi:hypothetical protein
MSELTAVTEAEDALEVSAVGELVQCDEVVAVLRGVT